MFDFVVIVAGKQHSADVCCHYGPARNIMLAFVIISSRNATFYTGVQHSADIRNHYSRIRRGSESC